MSNVLTTMQSYGLKLEPYPVMPAKPREKPMRVLCLGLSRTGTMSTFKALNELGLNCHHALEMARDNYNGSIKRWREAIEAKYFGGKGRRMSTAKDFDERLWRYQAVVDVPCCLFAEELLATYPEAKVILTVRDGDSWVASMERSYYRVLEMKAWWWLGFVDWTFTAEYIPFVHDVVRIWTDGDELNRQKLKAGYLRHNQRIREIVPPERLLEWHPSQGWDRFCSFLEVPVPDHPFPRVNEGDFTADLHSMVATLRIFRVLTWFVMGIGPLIVAGLAFYYYRY